MWDESWFGNGKCVCPSMDATKWKLNFNKTVILSSIFVSIEQIKFLWRQINRAAAAAAEAKLKCVIAFMVSFGNLFNGMCRVLNCNQCSGYFDLSNLNRCECRLQSKANHSPAKQRAARRKATISHSFSLMNIELQQSNELKQKKNGIAAHTKSVKCNSLMTCCCTFSIRSIAIWFGFIFIKLWISTRIKLIGMSLSISYAASIENAIRSDEVIGLSRLNENKVDATHCHCSQLRPSLPPVSI